MNLNFYQCKTCGKIIAVVSDSKTDTVCCGRKMEKLIPNSLDTASEKHVPVFCTVKNTVMVKIGSEMHPMTESHRIMWIGLRTSQGFQFKELQPQNSPEAWFVVLPGNRIEAVYAYCNIHGLWCSQKESCE